MIIRRPIVRLGAGAAPVRATVGSRIQVGLGMLNQRIKAAHDAKSQRRARARIMGGVGGKGTRLERQRM